MESIERYETSREELVKILDQSSSAAELMINISKLDSISKERLLSAVKNITAERIKDIDRVILGIKQNYQDIWL